MSPVAYADLIKQALESRADPVIAGQMRAYLRYQFPFLGIQTPIRRQALKALPPLDWDNNSLLTVAEILWNQPAREYRYVAIDLLKRYAKRLTIADVERLVNLSQREPWWETVDGMAGVVGDIVARERKTLPDAQAVMDEYLSHSSIWGRRIAMIHQLGWRLDTDESRLFRYATTLVPETEFFIRKAIGWALRDYARWNPEAVRRFVCDQQHSFSGLTLREASKHL